jgi:hypothetical protein
MIKKFISMLAVIMLFTVSFTGLSSSASANNSAGLPSHANDNVTISCHGTGMVLNGANIRSLPSTNSKKVGYVPTGTYLTGTLVTGDYVQNPYGGRSNKWLPIGEIGYISVTTMSFTCDW